MDTQLKSKLKNCLLVVTDVDGVLTDGKISYTSSGEELKSFNIKDGLGFKLIQNIGIQTAIITGRTSAMVDRRAHELGINHLVQGREDKGLALQNLCEELAIPLEQCLYIGDDLPDLKAIIAAGTGVATADAHAELIKHADYCCNLAGGSGAFREVSELILEARGLLTDLYAEYGAGI
jgi:3-deoxy-D-manno-octulosonate 8-phosphate phosphatase (KDO 8-P phosphatase)